MSGNKQKILEGWQVSKIGALCDVSAGGTPSTKIPEYWGGSILWMNSGDLNKKIVENVEGRITKKGLESSSAKLVPVNSVLIGLAGQGRTRGTVAINKVELTTNQSVAFFVPNKVYYKFLYYDLDRRYSELRSISAGDGGRGGLNLQILKNLKMLLPSDVEQKRIAEVLETWDKYLEKLDRKIEVKRKIKKGLTQSLLTGKKRLLGFSGDWREVRLKEIAPKIFDGTHQTPHYVEKGIPFYSVEHVTSNNFTHTKYIAESVFLKENERVRVEKGDILMSRIGDIGTARYIDWDAKASFYVTLALIKCVPGVNSKFVAFLISGQQAQREIWNRTLHVAFPNKINLGDIKTIRLSLPDMPEQIAIAKVLTDADTEIDLLKKQRDLVAEQKKYLLNNLITGQIRLPEFRDK